ncbi:MAG: hypothetical protein ABSG53_22120 [Thermoguttaceae bacterium]|jgi:hypothetical protein
MVDYLPAPTAPAATARGSQAIWSGVSLLKSVEPKRSLGLSAATYFPKLIKPSGSKRDGKG